MVMIIFKPQTEIKSGIILSDVENYELYGRELFAKYAYVQEQLVFDVGKLSILNICELALGMLLADYCFDKYISKKSEEYPKLESVVFLNNHYLEIQKKFETYTALANAIRFAKDLYHEPYGKYLTEQCFFEIKRLEYLGLGFKDCGDNLLRLIWKGTDTPKEQVIVGKNRQASAIGAGVMKVVALQQLPINLVAYLKIEGKLNDLVVKNPIYIKDNLTDELMLEQELRQVYMQVKGDAK